MGAADRFHFVVGSDAAYFEGLRVSTLTALLTLDRSRACTFHVLDCGLGEVHRTCLRQDFDRLKVRRMADSELVFVDVQMEKFSNLPKFAGDSRAAYARVLAAELLPVDSVVWIDADLLVLQDSSRIETEVAQNRSVAGAVDAFILTLENDPMTADLKAPDNYYINTGFLWMNLRRMREERFAERVIRLMNENRECLMYADQGPINSLTLGDRSVLPACYNQLLNETSDVRATFAAVEGGNIHFVGGTKPWKYDRRYGLLLQAFLYEAVYRALGLKPIEKVVFASGERRSLFMVKLAYYRACLSGNRRKMRRNLNYLNSLRHLDAFSEVVEQRLNEFLN